MINCAWCGAECDGRISFEKETTVIFVNYDEKGEMNAERYGGIPEIKFFCSEKHRLNWFVEP